MAAGSWQRKLKFRIDGGSWDWQQSPAFKRSHSGNGRCLDVSLPSSLSLLVCFQCVPVFIFSPKQANSIFQGCNFPLVAFLFSQTNLICWTLAVVVAFNENKSLVNVPEILMDSLISLCPDTCSFIKFGCFSCNFFFFLNLMEFGKLEGEIKNYFATWGTYPCHDYLDDKKMAWIAREEYLLLMRL